MQTTEEVVVRPFHETIVEAIRRCDLMKWRREMFFLFQLIKETKIPKGHDEIIAAIDQSFDFPEAEKWPIEKRLVKESLLAQKQAASQKDGEKKEVDLNSLDWEAEQLHYYIANPEPDSEQWKQSLQETIKNLHKLTSQALGK